jgi:hypothetical protein
MYRLLGRVAILEPPRREFLGGDGSQRPLTEIGRVRRTRSSVHGANFSENIEHVLDEWTHLYQSTGRS